MHIEMFQPAIDWEDLLLAWLHDPFDKALRVQGHEPRARQYAETALGREVSRKELHRLAAPADVQAAVAERLPSPTAGPNGERAVGPADGLKLTHPASGTCVGLRVNAAPQPDRAVALIDGIVRGLAEPRDRMLALWRLLPDRVAAEFGEDTARLPADTRIPDHTLFQHADIAAGLYAAGAPDGVAYLSFALGPVQPFIRAARSVRDLWTGSALLSWLAFQAMTPVLSTLGPTAFVYPSPRGAPLIDLWLRRDGRLGNRVPQPPRAARMAPSLPNRFLAVVPWGERGAAAAALRQACLDAALSEWRRVADAVRNSLDPQLTRLNDSWAQLWDQQIDSAFEFSAVAIPQHELSEDRLAQLVGADDFSRGWPEAQKIRDLEGAIPADHRPGYLQNSAGRWQAQMEISARIMTAARTVRHIPKASGVERGASPAKCSLFGSWEQMGPADFDASRKFWDSAAEGLSVYGVRLRPRERLCALALTKRFAGPSLLGTELEVAPADLRFPDTPTVAASEWLHKAGIDPDDVRRRNEGHWSGLWLHWRRPDQNLDEAPPPPADLWKRLREAKNGHGAPPAYYAVIAMDGDEIGQWLAGRKTPALRRLLHPKLRKYFEDLNGTRTGLDARRPVGPALHGAISAALSAFATEIAPEIVAAHNGTTIYSGGDDVLALCPVSTSLDCVHALRAAFSGRDDPLADGWRTCGERRRITMGASASMSAGLTVVHFREDLQLALEAARGAESRAKGAGRDLLDIVVARRSGETTNATCPWPFVQRLDELRRRFVAGAPDRWTYRLRAELPTLASDRLPRQAMQAELHRLVDRGGEDDAGVRTPSGGQVAALFEGYCNLRNRSGAADLLREFATLVQSAAFMARGGDA